MEIKKKNKIGRLHGGVRLQWKISEGVKMEVRTSVTFSWVVFLFLPHFDLIIDQLLNRGTAMCNLYI